VGQLAQLILDNLYKLWPVRLIDADCQGVRFTLGKFVKRLEPGPHLFFPGLQEIEEWSVAYQEIDCKTQSVDTTDGEPMTFSANVGYTIEDAKLMRTEVHNFDSTLERATRGILGDMVAECDLKSLRRSRKKLAADTLNALREETSGWGVTIHKVRLTDFTRAEQQRRFNTAD
jgi:regulator of protease activity HflC (stomatin/prohibitin superfamily)